MRRVLLPRLPHKAPQCSPAAYSLAVLLYHFLRELRLYLLHAFLRARIDTRLQLLHASLKRGSTPCADRLQQTSALTPTSRSAAMGFGPSSLFGDPGVGSAAIEGTDGTGRLGEPGQHQSIGEDRGPHVDRDVGEPTVQQECCGIDERPVGSGRRPRARMIVGVDDEGVLILANEHDPAAGRSTRPASVIAVAGSGNAGMPATISRMSRPDGGSSTGGSPRSLRRDTQMRSVVRRPRSRDTRGSEQVGPCIAAVNVAGPCPSP
ncbi:hypothetical protein SAMN04489733_1179 [Amycolatopsis keratiniphila]|nr:hypothetical protein SAMN04489733_1179 [Amycolatopsis keratiniphila]